MIGRTDLRIGLLSGVLALLIAAYLFPPGARAGDSLAKMDVPNSGFESEQTSAAIPDWNYWNSSYGMLTISTAKKFSGSQSLRFEKTETGTNKSFGAESAKLDVKAGETYEASIKLNIESMVNNPALWIRWFDSSGQPLEKQAVYAIPSNSPLNSWLDIKVKGTAPLDAAKATIFVYASTAVKLTANVDDVQLFRLADYNFLLNPGFEESTVGTTLPPGQGWSLYKNSQPANTQYSIVTDPGGSSKVLRIWDDNDTSPSGSIGVNTDTIFVSEGLAYEANLKSKLVSGSQIAYIKFYSDPGGMIEVAGGSFSTGITNANNAWNSVTVTGVAPENAIRARVVLYSSTGAKSEGYFDDVSFYLQGLDSSHSRKSPIDLGEATLGRLTKGGAIKNGEIYFATNGSPATFYAFNAITRELIDSERVPGTDVVWGITVGSDNNVYFASTVANNRKLYKYDVSARAVSAVGQYPSSNSFVWDLESVGEKIYGATSGANGEVFSYDIDAASNPFSPIGSINPCPGTLYPCQEYVRGLGSSGNDLYAGMGSDKYLTRTNLTNGVTEEIELSSTGQDGFISDISVRNGYLYIAQTSSLIVMDPVSESEVRAIYGADRISERIPGGSSALMYYQNVFNRKLYAYNSANLGSNPVLVTTVTEFPDSAVRAMEWINDNGRYKLAILFEDTRYALYDPKSDTPADDDTLSSYQLATGVSALNIQSLARAPDGKFYLGGYLGGMSVYDDANGGQYLAQYPGPHQIEEIGFLGNTAYLGVYSGAKIYQYAYGGTPALIGTIGSVQNEQDRPYVFTSGESKLFVGTIPTYGKLGGALSIYDGTSWLTYRNVVLNQSVIALAYRSPQRVLYGGTSVEGGLGSSADESAVATIFKWNVATNGEIGTEFTPDIPGMDVPKMIGHLSFGPDGKLWGGAWGILAEGAADTGYALFKMDPDTHAVLDSEIVYKNASSGSPWRGFYLYWHDGKLYTTLGRYLTVFDPNDLSQNTRILNSNVTLMTMDADGNLFYAVDSRLYKLLK